MANEQKDLQNQGGQGAGNAQRATNQDTLAEQGARPVPAQPAPAPTGAEVVGAAGGTDASAAARQSGNTGPGGKGLRDDGVDATGMPGTPGGTVSTDRMRPATDSAAAGGTGLGEAASAADTRTGTGTSSGHGTSLTGGGKQT
ncbi:hypothetical protein [Pseudoduganella albidiflava]|uniref:Uncharacterized protein n=1 Tax=Pseudoduganella albidiflava TaxID=321983 RepID=A0A411X490_9BURK|nr:hypothetical protein [Pseudoduganella albidiflava]QBI03744.1 hypothetical protein EYF70_25175 [Pseudoduganella albidiflava]GGY62003.1 hypothetical protein GCM10007387_50740 [Pseudoduganella albidiflava]